MVMNDTKIYQKMKNKSWFSMEKTIKKREKKCIIITIGSYFHLENLACYLQVF